MKLLSLERTDPRELFPRHYDFFAAEKQLYNLPTAVPVVPDLNNAGEELVRLSPQELYDWSGRFHSRSIDDDETTAYFRFGREVLTRTQLLFCKWRSSAERVDAFQKHETWRFTTPTILFYPREKFGGLAPNSRFLVQGQIEAAHAWAPTQRQGLDEAEEWRITKFGLRMCHELRTPRVRVEQIFSSPSQPDAEAQQFCGSLRGERKYVRPVVAGDRVRQLLELAHALTFIEDGLSPRGIDWQQHPYWSLR